MGAIEKIRGTKRLYVIAIVLAIVVFTSIRCSNNKNSGNIHITGNIELTEISIAFKIPGRLAQLNVEEGDYVKKGMIIACLDTNEPMKQRERAEALLASSNLRAARLRTAIEFQKENVKGQIEIRRAEQDQAMALLKELESGSRVQEIEKAKAVVERAKTEHEHAKTEWERAQKLYINEDISTASRDIYKAAYESSLASLKQAQEQLALVIEGPRAENIEAAQSQVARAKAALNLAEAQRLEIKMKKIDLEIALTEVKNAQAELSLIEIKLEDSTATSPIDGVVLVKVAEAGEIIGAGTPVVTIGDMYNTWLRGYINEPDLDRVKLGSKVRVKTDSGGIFQGNVSFISSEAEFTPKQIQTKQERVKLVYRIKVAIENPKGELKRNMPVEAEILIN